MDESKKWLREKRRQLDRLRRQEWTEIVDGHDREWWRAEAKRTRTDWSSLLRQRIRAKAWIKAGCPPIAEWLARQNKSG